MRIVTIGDNCLDWYLDRGKIYPGGNAVNVAVYTHRLGADSAYIGQFGDDLAGDVMVNALAQEGVDINRIRRIPGRSSYATVRNIAGDRVFQGSADGVVAFEPQPDDYSFVHGADLIHTGDSSFLEEYVAQFAEIAPVSFDFSIKPDSYCEELLPFVTYATFSRPELTPAEVPVLIQRAHDLGVTYVQVTQGVAGAWLSDGDHLHHEPAVLTEVVDTLGAGDSFISGVLFSLLSGDSITQTAAKAAAVAAEACRSYGGFGYETSAEGMTMAPDHRSV